MKSISIISAIAIVATLSAESLGQTASAGLSAAPALSSGLATQASSPGIGTADPFGQEDDAARRAAHRRVQVRDDLVPGTPFVVFVGKSATEPVLLLGAGLVPDMGSQELTVSADVELQVGQQIYVRNGDVIVCFIGREIEDDRPATVPKYPRIHLYFEAPPAIGKGGTLSMSPAASNTGVTGEAAHG